MWTLTFHLGQKTGQEVFYRDDSTKVWQKTYAPSGGYTWVEYDENGRPSATSEWKNKTLLEVSK
jgi:hypothetical protein